MRRRYRTIIVPAAVAEANAEATSRALHKHSFKHSLSTYSEGHSAREADGRHAEQNYKPDGSFTACRGPSAPRGDDVWALLVEICDLQYFLSGLCASLQGCVSSATDSHTGGLRRAQPLTSSLTSEA